MKIFYLITKSNWGGAQKYVYDLSKHFSRKNEVTVFYGENGELEKKLQSLKIKTVKIKGLDKKISVFNDFKIFFKLINIFRKEKPDIIHLNSSKISGLGSLAGRIANVKKIIFTIHGLPFNEDRSFLQKKLIKLLTYLSALFSHKIIIISKNELNEIKNWFFLSKKLYLIHNGIQKNNFLNKENARDYFKKQIKNFPSEKTTWVGTISELTKNKGLEYAINSFKELKEKNNFIFIIIGEGEEKENLQNLIKKEGLENKIFIIGFIKNANTYLKAFDIFLLSSIKEGLPYVLLEAGQAQNTIIATKTGGISEIIKDKEEGFLIQPKDKKAITKKILFYKENQEIREKMGEKIKIKIEEKFSIQKMIEKTEKIYYKN